VHSGFARFLLRRAAFAALLVLLVSSSALILADLAPADDAFGTDRAILAARRKSAGLDLPLYQQYATWVRRSIRLDFGESLHFRRPVAALIKERAANTALLGVSALALATLIGVPLGVVTGSAGRGLLPGAARLASMVLLSDPPLFTSLVMLFAASRTGWFPAGGLPDWGLDAGTFEKVSATARYLFLPALALALPIAASLERRQSHSIRDALAEPCILAALARGVPRRRVIWRHALRLSLPPVLAIYGIIIGAILSGSFAVEIVMSWQGLGDLMYQALKARDLYLVAGCATTGACGLAAGILLSDLMLAAIDPRVEAPA
jgi:peptide/nickel transport system permease protein